MNFFFDREQNKIKKVVKGNEESTIECLMLFKENIEPTWEDPANCTGGSFILEIDMANQTHDQVKQVWKTVVYSLIGNYFPYADQVTGFRFLDRMKFNNLKIELWTTIQLTNGNVTKE